MTSGMLFALAISALVVAVLFGLVRRQRLGGGKAKSAEGAATVQWTEGETTRLLSSAELPGLYLLRSRFLSKAENVVYLLLKAAFPRHEIFARIRLADVLQVAVVASLASAPRRDVLTCCDVQPSTYASGTALWSARGPRDSARPLGSSQSSWRPRAVMSR